jgi:hypothetical protein
VTSAVDEILAIARAKPQTAAHARARIMEDANHGQFHRRETQTKIIAPDPYSHICAHHQL